MTLLLQYRLVSSGDPLTLFLSGSLSSDGPLTRRRSSRTELDVDDHKFLDSPLDWLFLVFTQWLVRIKMVVSWFVLSVLSIDL